MILPARDGRALWEAASLRKFLQERDPQDFAVMVLPGNLAGEFPQQTDRANSRGSCARFADVPRQTDGFYPDSCALPGEFLGGRRG